MSETSMKILEGIGLAVKKMSEPEQEKLLWFCFCEGLAAAARAQGAAQDSA